MKFKAKLTFIAKRQDDVQFLFFEAIVARNLFRTNL